MVTKSRMMMLCALCLSLLLLTNSLQAAQAQGENGPETPTQKIFLPVIQTGAGETDEIVAAFTHPWHQGGRLNVAATECGLWDDMPGPGANANNDEAGLLWFLTNSSADEKCSYWSEVNNISTNVSPFLQVHVAVNDGAIFKVEVFERDPLGEFCDRLVSAITTGANQDDSEFRTFQVRLPANKIICQVQITLDDAANNIASFRASALIDHIWLWNGVNNAGVIWWESFSQPN